MQVISRKTFLILSGTLGTVTLLLLCAFWYALATDSLCLVRTGIEPKEEYLKDREAFISAVSASRNRAADSLARQFDTERGFFVYEQYPDGSVGGGNNDIRQLLASRILAQNAHTDEAMRTLHEENLEAIFREWWKTEGGIGYVFVDEKSKLGANAMLLRVLVASPFFETYREEARMLVESMRTLQGSDGSFKAWFKEPSYTYDEPYLLTFYSGEAILALLEYAEKTGDTGTYASAERAQDFYMTEYVEDIEENYYPAYVPWHTLALAEFYKKTNDERYAAAVMVLNDKLLEMLDTEEFIGRFYNSETSQYGSPHASSDAVYTEGLASAYEVARLMGDAERETQYREALVRAWSNLESLQFETKWYSIFDDRGVTSEMRGGVMTNACERVVRIDSTAHTVDAFNNILRVF